MTLRKAISKTDRSTNVFEVSFVNNKIIMAICDYFGLGRPIETPIRIYGGLLHIMWRLITEKGTYAIKQLSQDINLFDSQIVRNYNLTEYIAFCFIQQGISAVCALEQSGNYLLVLDGVGYLVYPWIAGTALDKDAISENKALQIPEILARMHNIDLSIPEILEPEFDIHKNDDIVSFVQKALDYQCPFAKLLKDKLPDLLKANSTYQRAIPILKKQAVVSHGDLDQKNVLWDKFGNPILIDWESARKLNPTYEIVNASLDWSGITTEFNKELFFKLIKAYKKARGIIDNSSLEASFYGVLGNWINWLVYNIDRSCNNVSSEQQKIGIEQVAQVLPTILRLQTLGTELLCQVNDILND